MKNSRFPNRFAFVLWFWFGSAVALSVCAADLAVMGNLTVTGTTTSAGAIDSDSNTFTFGTQGASFGGSLLYQDNGVDTLTFGINRSPASWLWQDGGGIKAMRLDSAHQLLLFNAAGTTAGITLTPASNQISLGTATLSGSGSNVIVGGTLTAQSSVINNGTITGGATGLNILAGGANQNIVLTPSGAGNTLLGGNVGFGTTAPLRKVQFGGDTDGFGFEVGTGSPNSGAIRFGDGTGWKFHMGRSRDSNGGPLNSGQSGLIATFQDNGNVGIGTSSPISTLQVLGPITAGSAARSTAGIDYLYGYYDSGKLFVLGSQYSSGAAFLGYGVKALSGATGYSSSTSVPIGRSAIEANMGYVSILTGGTQTSTDGGAVSIFERVRIDLNGNVGIGTTTPQYKISLGSPSDRIGWYSDPAHYNSIEFYNSSTGGMTFDLNTASGGGYEWKFAGAPLVAFQSSGNVGIGTTTPTHKLSVNGTIRAKEIIVDTGWADYVFEDDYRLAPLSEVEAHIRAKKHLPGIPSAAEVAAHGVSMGDMQSRLLAKIEELTLRQIAQEKQLNAQAARMNQIERENLALKSRLREPAR